MNKITIWPTTRRGWLYVPLTLAAVLMAATFLLWSPAQASKRARAAGTIAPDFQAIALDGQVIHLADYAGRPVLLNFFSTTCNVSADAVVNINALLRERPDLVILSINTNRASGDEIRAWGQQHGALFPLIADPDGYITQLYRPYATPFWVFIRPEGVIAATRLGEHRTHNLLYRLNEYLPVSSEQSPVIGSQSTNLTLPTDH